MEQLINAATPYCYAMLGFWTFWYSYYKYSSIYNFRYDYW